MRFKSKSIMIDMCLLMYTGYCLLRMQEVIKTI